MEEKQKQDKFMEAFEPNRQKLSAYALALTRNRDDAKDIVSETILKAYESFEKVKDTQAFSAYLFTIASRIFKRKLWRRRIFGEYNQEYAETIPAGTVSPETRFDIETLYKALDKLPAKQKEAVILFEISGFSIEEICEIQGGTISGVKSRLKRGRETLTEIMHKTYGIKTNTLKIINFSNGTSYESESPANHKQFSLRVENERF